MKQKILYIISFAFVLIACNKTAQNTDTCINLLINTYSDGKFLISKWGDYRWLVLPQDEHTSTYRAEFMLLDSEDRDLPIIVNKISADFGEPFAQNTTAPTELNQYDKNLFALPNNRALEEIELLFWWQTDEYIIRLYETNGHSEVEMPAVAVISIYDKERL